MFHEVDLNVPMAQIAWQAMYRSHDRQYNFEIKGEEDARGIVIAQTVVFEQWYCGKWVPSDLECERPRAIFKGFKFVFADGRASRFVCVAGYDRESGVFTSSNLFEFML